MYIVEQLSALYKHVDFDNQVSDLIMQKCTFLKSGLFRNAFTFESKVERKYFGQILPNMLNVKRMSAHPT